VDVDLDLDGPRLDPEQGEGSGGGEHRPKLRPATERVARRM
jgi:hypothetical protein